MFHFIYYSDVYSEIWSGKLCDACSGIHCPGKKRAWFCMLCVKQSTLICICSIVLRLCNPMEQHFIFSTANHGIWSLKNILNSWVDAWHRVTPQQLRCFMETSAMVQSNCFAVSLKGLLFLADVFFRCVFYFWFLASLLFLASSLLRFSLLLRFFAFPRVPAFLLLCFPAFLLLCFFHFLFFCCTVSLPLCFSVFFCFSSFSASLLSAFPCFSA